MTLPWVTLKNDERASYQVAVSFLNGRLAETGTIEWALGLESSQHVERMAVIYVLNSPGGQVLKEPWTSAWLLIEESWSQNPVQGDPSTDIYDIRQRLYDGDRSGAILSLIVNLVAPFLNVEVINPHKWLFLKKPRRPKSVNHLLSTSLTSGDLVDLNDLGLAELSDVPFLTALTTRLEAVVNHGLDIARRIGWSGEPELWRMGSLHRVGYAQTTEQRESDIPNRGIAPSVKLLHAVVIRIAELEPRPARSFVFRWRHFESPVHVRMWSAAALNPLLVSAKEVGEFLVGLDDRQFWDLEDFPEIVELRALRFAELDSNTQKKITIRLRKGPPRNFWPKEANAAKVKDERLYWAVREFKRIEIVGSASPFETRSFLEAGIEKFPDLASMNFDDGFPGRPLAEIVPRTLDNRYDALSGTVRLYALEDALSTEPYFDDDPATGTRDWLRQPGKTALVLDDLESVRDGGGEFPCVVNRFSWTHKPEKPEAGNNSDRDLQDEAERVLQLLANLPHKTLSDIIHGISEWLYVWREQVIASALGLQVWQQIWPIAVEATNADQPPEERAELSISPHTTDDDWQTELDTFNTPSAKLVSVFLRACPSFQNVGRVPGRGVGVVGASVSCG